jgi:hypothetical protein
MPQKGYFLALLLTIIFEIIVKDYTEKLAGCTGINSIKFLHAGVVRIVLHPPHLFTYFGFQFPVANWILYQPINLS